MRRLASNCCTGGPWVASADAERPAGAASEVDVEDMADGEHGGRSSPWRECCVCRRSQAQDQLLVLARSGAPTCFPGSTRRLVALALAFSVPTFSCDHLHRCTRAPPRTHPRHNSWAFASP